MDYASYIGVLEKQLKNHEKTMTLPIIRVILPNETREIYNPVQLRKSIQTLHSREKRENQANEKRLEELRMYFQSQNLLSNTFDPTPYEIPHSDSFDDMLDTSEYQ